MTSFLFRHFIFSLSFLLSIFQFSVRGELCGKHQFTSGFSVDYKRHFRGGKARVSFTEAVVTWTPESDFSCLNFSSLSLFVSSSDWEKNDSETDYFSESPTIFGSSFKWSLFNLKPCLIYSFSLTYKNSNDDESMEPIRLALAEKLGPSTDLSDFTPEAPRRLSVQSTGSSSILSWRTSVCASSYELNYVLSGSSSWKSLSILPKPNESIQSVRLSDLVPCSLYDVILYSLSSSSLYSKEAKISFATEPSTDEALIDFEPLSFVPNSESFSLSWSKYPNFSCINSYAITLCSLELSECRDTEKLNSNDSHLIYKVSELTPCNDYTLEILPLYKDLSLTPKVFPFRTLAPSPYQYSLRNLSWTFESSTTLQLDWSPSPCSSKYLIYSKKINTTSGATASIETEADSENWVKVGETSESNILLRDLTPCTSLIFGVSALFFDSELETRKSLSDTLVSSLNSNTDYELPHLKIESQETSALLTWSHAPCISHYSLSLCSLGPENCFFNTSIFPSNEFGVQTLKNLTPCTTYRLQLTPLLFHNSDKIHLVVKALEFQTKFGDLVPPSNVKGFLDEEKNTFSLYWTQVNCSSGTKILESHTGESIRTNESFIVFSSLSPCSSYSYSLKSLLNSVESLTSSSSVSFVTPPSSSSIPPLLTIHKVDTDNLTLILNIDSSVNSKCEVREIEITYGLKGLPPASLSSLDSQISLAFTGASGPSAVIKARLLYGAPGTNSTLWSPQVSSECFECETFLETSSENVTGNSGGTLHLLIAIFVVFALLSLLSFFLLRKKKRKQEASSSYTASSTEKNSKSRRGKTMGPGSLEETSKLNEPVV